MRYLLYTFVAIIFLSACDNKLELLEAKKETPVVYGFIDSQDTAQYIRIERAFSDPNVSASKIAQIADSLYYDDIKVTLSSGGKKEVLQRVDGSAEGYPRQKGVFADAPNYLYKSTTLPIVPKSEVTLSVEGKNVNFEVATTVLGKPRVSNFKARKLYFDPIGKFNLAWNAGESNEVYAAILNIHYNETRDGKTETKILPWLVEDYTDVTRLEFKGIGFYQHLGSNLQADPAIKRNLTGVSLRLIAGDAVIKKYITIGLANLGITSSGEIPKYSNIPTGLGAYGSTYTLDTDALELTDIGIIELRNNQYTKALNF